VLMEILGRQTMIEIPSCSIIRERDERAEIYQPKTGVVAE